MKSLQFYESDGTEIGKYTYGTVHGNWLECFEEYMRRMKWSTRPAICINNIYNDISGNGDFDACMRELEAYCIARNHDLMFLDVKDLFGVHLMRKRGFEKVTGNYHYVKKLQSQPQLQRVPEI